MRLHHERYACGALCAVGLVDEHGARVGTWRVYFETGEPLREVEMPRKVRDETL